MNALKPSIFVFILFQVAICHFDKINFPVKQEIEFKGITFVGDKYCPEVTYESDLADLSLNKLAATGANWVAVVVTEYQDYINSTSIYPLYASEEITNSYYTYKTESILGLTKIINSAHAMGLKVLLKPHIDLAKEQNFTSVWRGDIGKTFSLQQEWDEWFTSYTNFITKYASLAEMLRVEMLSVSCELIHTSKMDTHWRKVIKAIKQRYSGLLVDSANHDGEEYEKKWWDEMDYIGVDAYYLPIQSPLLVQNKTNVELALNLSLYKLKALATKFNKDVIFTEIGFCSGNCKIDNRNYPPTPSDHYLQAYFYESFFKTFLGKGFIKGFFWWAWNSDPFYGGGNDNCISPQYKVAEFVLRSYYGGNVTNLSYYPEKEPTCACTI